MVQRWLCPSKVGLRRLSFGTETRGADTVPSDTASMEKPESNNLKGTEDPLSNFVGVCTKGVDVRTSRMGLNEEHCRERRSTDSTQTTTILV